jgi:hypothetical protein
VKLPALGRLPGGSAHCSHIDCHLLNAIQPQHAVHLFIVKCADGTDTQAEGLRYKVEVLADVAGVNIRDLRFCSALQMLASPLTSGSGRDTLRIGLV